MKKYLSTCYFILIFCLLTLFMHDGYFDVLETKGRILLLFSIFYVVSMTVYSVIWHDKDSEKITFTLFDYAMIAFAGINILSAFLSTNQKELDKFFHFYLF